MKVGKLVKFYIKNVFDDCEKNNVNELSKLMNKEYSKDKFNINFPFCTEDSSIPASQSPRYWKNKYEVNGKVVRVCSQWFTSDKKYFIQYLLTHKLVELADLKAIDVDTETSRLIADSQSSVRKGRYKGNPIGNAQNLLVRHILSNLGEESFNESDWEESKEYFSHCCAYCGVKEILVMEHAIPINKESLGEHRLGNLVPSCERCNRNKGSKDFRKYLGGDEERVIKVEKYMESWCYVPLEKDNEQIEKLLEMARQDVSSIANRYITILNELFLSNSNK